VVSVADEGIGIGPEDKASLFTTFHRIQRPETQSIRGSGLGLYIAKEWTEAMGGEIWLESELNKGSTFFVAIPTKYSNETK
jgi:signal transduction histidine kinase